MKRKLFLFVCLLATGWGVCHAQDVIVTRDAKKISAKITEVNPDDVKYRNFDNLDGPTYTLLKSQIASILYQNGTVETFEAEAGTPATQPSATPSAATQPAAVNFNRQQQAGRPLRSSIRDYPVYYAEYRKGRSMQTRGIILLISGAVMAAGGGLTVGLLSEDQMSDSQSGAVSVGGTFLAIGSGCIIASIPVMIIGGGKKRKAMNSYLQQVSELPARNAPHLRLNLHGNGLGLAYVF
jgi:hypothetical protein